MYKDNKGFTLVELACIVMILLVLAAIAIPTFSKFLSNTSDERNAEMAQDIMNKAQVLFYEEYADGIMSDDRKCVIPGSNGVNFKYTDSDKNDCDVHKKPFANDFLKSFETLNGNKLGNVVLIALGRSDIYGDPESELYDPVKAYTVYMSIYQPYPNNRVCFLTNDGTSYSKNPVGNNKNKWTDFYFNGVKVSKKVDFITIDNEKIYIQYYAIKNGLNNGMELGKMWSILNANYD